MPEEPIKHIIQGLIADGKLEEAIRRLCDYYEAEDQKAFQICLSLSRRLHNTEEERRRGVISRESAEVERTKITEAVLILAAGKYPAGLEEEKGRIPHHFRKSYLYLLLGVLVTAVAISAGIVNGLPFPNNEPTSFDLKIQVRKADKQASSLELSQGTVKIQIRDTYFGPKALSADGEAFFPALPTTFLEDTVSLIPVNRKWEIIRQSAKTPAESPTQTITFFVAPVSDTILWRGTVVNPSGRPVANAQINIGQGLVVDSTNAAGNFNIKVPLLSREPIQVTVTVDGKERRRGFFTLSEKIQPEITLNPD